jgi:hypothetical protein
MENVVRESISIEPTPEGYASIARRFAGQIIDDLPRRRVADDRILLDSLIELVAYLAATGRRDLIASIRDDVDLTRRHV